MSLGKTVKTTHHPSDYRKRYEAQKNSGLNYYDTNMEYHKENDVESGAWVLITRTIPVMEHAKPKLFGIYWGIPTQDKFDRQVCIIHTTEDVTLLNHEYTVLSEEKVNMYRQEGWEIHETKCNINEPMNMELLEKGRELCEEEREIIWALQLDGLSEIQACEEYFLTKHTDYNNFSICYLPKPEIYEELIATFGER